MRKWLFVLALVSSILAVAVAAGWVLLPDWAKGRLSALGLGDVDFVIDSLSPGQLSVSDIRFGIGQEQHLDRIIVLFRPTELLRSRTADSVSIEGADLHLVWPEKGIPHLAGVSSPGPTSADAALRIPAIPVKAVELRDSSLHLSTGAGRFDLPLSGALAQTESGAWTLDARMTPHSGGMHADLRLEAHLEPDGAAKVQARLAKAEGWLPGRTDALGQALVILERDGSGRLSGEGRLELDLADSQAVLDLKAHRAPMAGSPLSFAVRMMVSDLDMSLLHSLDRSVPELEGHASLQAQLEGTLPVPATPRWQQATASGRVSFEIADGGVAGSVEDTSAQVVADLSLSGTALTAVPLGHWKLTGHLVGPGSPASFQLSDAEGQRLALTLGADPAAQEASGAVDFRLERPSRPTISGTASGRVERVRKEALQLALDRLKIDPATWALGGLKLHTKELEAQLTGTVSRLQGEITAELDASGTLPGDTRITGAKASLGGHLTYEDGRLALETEDSLSKLELAERAVAVSDIALSLVQDQSTSVTLKHAVVRSLSSPPAFPDLALAGEASGRLDGVAAFEVTARGEEVPLVLSAKGKHDFTLAIGEMSYELDKIRFSPAGIQPRDIFPATGELIKKAQGSLGLSGGISWVAGVPMGYSWLALSDLGFDAPGLRVRGVDTRLQRAGPTVRNRLASQEIRVDLLDVGLPLRNGLIRFHTKKAPAIRIEKLRFAWGGGTLQAKPFDLRLDKLSALHSILLDLDRVQLNALLELFQVEGLQGTGTLSGPVPLRVRGSEIGVDHGLISADGPGVLRYRPEHKPAFFARSSETELLFGALQNFRYDSLSVGLNGRTRDDLQLSISLAGSNPDLYNGHPFKLNFNISGELDTIVRRSLSVATFAERLGELLSRYLR